MQRDMFFFVQEDLRLAGRAPLPPQRPSAPPVLTHPLLSSNRRSQTLLLLPPPGGAEGAVGGEEKLAQECEDRSQVKLEVRGFQF